ncbi:MAG: hypothetical protein K5696_04395, partial [Lachnospiraceae bacterium]|nr:hypothetical protein [Lachnospiraceae bacterium]
MFETLNTIADILFTFLRSALLAFFACKYFDPRWFHRKWGNVTVFAVSRTLLQIILFDPWDSY